MNSVSIKKLEESSRKINELVSIMSKNAQEVSAIERDLLMDVLRRMYEDVLSLGVDATVNTDNDAVEEIEKEEKTSLLTDEKDIDVYAPLLVDTTVAPQYAEEESLTDKQSGDTESVSVEEIEQNGNDIIFETGSDEEDIETETSDDIEEKTIEEAVTEEIDTEKTEEEETAIIVEAEEEEPEAPIEEEGDEPANEEQPTDTGEPQNEPATVVSQHEAPTTIWEKLQKAEHHTIGESLVGSAMIIDKINGMVDSKEEATAQPLQQETAEKEAEEESAPLQTENEEVPTSTPLENDAEPVVDKVEEAVQDKEEKPVEEPEATQEKKKTVQQPSLFDYMKQNTPSQPTTNTIADSIARELKKTTEPRTAVNKVSDLRTIININDKFSFMNELFHSNMKGYNDFISHLNSMTDREEALAYVEQIATQHHWDKESSTVTTFNHIFDRKF